MVQVFLHTPTRVYLKLSSKFDDFDECKKFINDNKKDLKKWGYYFTIRDVDFTCLYRVGSQFLQM